MVIMSGAYSPTYVLLTGAYSLRQHYNNWMVWPILVGVPVLVGWHLELIVKRPGYLTRAHYFVYAIGNVACYVFIGIYCLGTVTGDWL
jgi:hypothetical protein